MESEKKNLNIPFSEYKNDLLKLLELANEIKLKYKLSYVTVWDIDSSDGDAKRTVCTSTGDEFDSFSNVFNYDYLSWTKK